MLPKSRQKQLVVQESGNETLIYDLESDKAYYLNATAAAVWQLCDGESPISEVAAKATNLTGQQISTDIVELTLSKLAENQLLEVESGFHTQRVSRREILRRAGLATMAALPVVASLAAPKTVMAATSCNCNALSDCVLQLGCPSVLCSGGLCRP